MESLRQETEDGSMERLAFAEGPQVQPSQQGGRPCGDAPHHVVPARPSLATWRRVEGNDPSHGQTQDDSQRNGPSEIRVRKYGGAGGSTGHRARETLSLDSSLLAAHASAPSGGHVQSVHSQESTEQVPL